MTFPATVMSLAPMMSTPAPPFGAAAVPATFVPM